MLLTRQSVSRSNISDERIKAYDRLYDTLFEICRRLPKEFEIYISLKYMAYLMNLSSIKDRYLEYIKFYSYIKTKEEYKRRPCRFKIGCWIYASFPKIYKDYRKKRNKK